MRTLIIYLFASVLSFSAPVADFATALEQSKTTKAPIAVLIHGSDWNKQAEVFATAWKDPKFTAATGDLLLVSIDRKESPSEAEAEAAKRNEACEPPYRSLPCVALYDSEGRLVAVRSGVSEIMASKGLPGTIKSMRAVLTERDALWAKAANANGPQKAILLGSGLDRMNQGLGPKNLYKPVLDQMKAADPKDESGYIGKYTFSHWDLLSMVMDKAKKNEQAAAEEELAKWNRNTRLNARQRQELHATRYALYQRWPEKKDSTRSALLDMQKADPKSDLGIAAAKQLEQLK
jgi:hypothetical protein